jgi:hypothetical protein
MSIAGYWWRVVVRAFFDTLGLFGASPADWNIAQGFVWLAPLVVTAIVYFAWDGRDAVKRDFAKPLVIAVISYIACGLLALTFMLVRTPALLEWEQSEEQSKRLNAPRHASDVLLPASRDDVKAVAQEAAELVVLRGRVTTLERENAALRATMDDSSGRRLVKKRLGEYLSACNDLVALVADTQKPVPTERLDRWIGELERYLGDVDESYVTRSRSGSGLSIGGYRSDTPFSPERLRAFTGLRVRCARLEQFIAELK